MHAMRVAREKAQLEAMGFGGTGGQHPQRGGIRRLGSFIAGSASVHPTGGAAAGMARAMAVMSSGAPTNTPAAAAASNSATTSVPVAVGGNGIGSLGSGDEKVQMLFPARGSLTGPGGLLAQQQQQQQQQQTHSSAKAPKSYVRKSIGAELLTSPKDNVAPRSAAEQCRKDRTCLTGQLEGCTESHDARKFPHVTRTERRQ
jgi:hypothetical protein